MPVFLIIRNTKWLFLNWIMNKKRDCMLTGCFCRWCLPSTRALRMSARLFLTHTLFPARETVDWQLRCLQPRRGGRLLTSLRGEFHSAVDECRCYFLIESNTHSFRSILIKYYINRSIHYWFVWPFVWEPLSMLLWQLETTRGTIKKASGAAILASHL